MHVHVHVHVHATHSPRGNKGSCCRCGSRGAIPFLRTYIQIYLHTYMHVYLACMYTLHACVHTYARGAVPFLRFFFLALGMPDALMPLMQRMAGGEITVESAYLWVHDQ